MEPKTIEWRPGPAVCRCCLAEGCYKDISTEYFWMGKREVYAEMLSETLDLSIAYSTSGGPNSNSRLICEQCISKLRDATEFKRQVQECERTFIQWLDPGNSVADATATEVKLEQVKKEKNHNSDEDDDFNDQPDFGDDDGYDDLDDDVPLTKYASKTPKKEPVDLQDLLDNVKPTTKRKSTTTKDKSTAKKAKVSKEKATSSKPKPEKKKKGSAIIADSKDGLIVVRRHRKLAENVCARQMRRRRRANNELAEESDKRIAITMMRRNAMTILTCSTAWPFRWCHSAFYCSYCDKKFVDPSSLREHVRKHLSEEITKRVFSKLKENNMAKIDISELRCRICKEELHDMDSLKNHLIELHNKVWYKKYNDGVLPFKLHSNDFECQICFKSFVLFSKLNEHMNSHYKNYVCDACGKAFISKSRFRTHVQSHETGSFPCGECNEVLDTRAARRSHKGRVHRKGIRYSCPRCSEVFTSYHARVTHLFNRHDQKLDYKCLICGKLFENNSKLTAHFKSKHKSKEQFSGSSC
ncbi:PR domain zinc finger protein 5-like isoform X12 [Aricia agestis]|uniref:PR domain zinc finger protein 5-like isoform X12 n=1 Tax=Aricia agestis TaxID=91739 RepID=UPI001C208117|nr:PR domain zinc finger protein 5-like isoform X12 [Aricia agestis]